MTEGAVPQAWQGMVTSMQQHEEVTKQWQS